MSPSARLVACAVVVALWPAPRPFAAGNTEILWDRYGVPHIFAADRESMFHAQRDASKVALMALVELMRKTGMTLLDVQWQTEHLESLGAKEIGRRQYLALLADALRKSG